MSDCIVSKKTPNKRYAYVTFRGKQWAEHRMVWVLNFEEIPEGLLVCHKCNVPRCVNPEHLFLGTHLDNNRDRMKKDRGVRGSRVNTSKLSKEDVLWIIDLKTSLTGSEIACMFGVTRGAVYHIWKNRNWRRIS